MIYKLFTGQYIDMTHILTISGPRDTIDACHSRIGAFEIEFKFRDNPVTFTKKLKYEPRTLDCDSSFGEAARADWKQFENDFGAFIGDWMNFVRNQKSEGKIEFKRI